MIIVSNTTPLIGLASIQRFDLLRLLFGAIIIPPAVYEEAVTRGREAGGDRREVSSAPWIAITPAKDRLAVEVLMDELDSGEAETVILASEICADWTLMDERKGRRKLAKLGLKKIGTVGILLAAKKAGYIHMIRPEIEKLRQNAFSISQEIVDSILLQANEA